MKALVKKKPQKGLWYEDIPTPDIKPDEVLIKIRQTAICGTDVHIYQWDEWSRKTVPVPMTIGHEFMGTIEKMGSLVTGYELGQRVSGEGHIVCGYCRNCRAGTRHLCNNTQGVGIHRPGAFAQYLALPAVNVFPLSDSITDDQAAVLDPLGNAVHCALFFDLVGEDVLITGAGPIGIMAAAVCQHVGARNVVVTDQNPYRLALARKMGDIHTVNIRDRDLQEMMDELGMTEGFDVGLEMSGSAEALRQMIDTAKPGAKLALLGILPQDAAIAWDQVIFKGLVLKGIYGRQMFDTWYKMCAMLQSGLNIEPVFTHAFPVTDFQRGFEVMMSGQSGKVVLDWSVL